MNHHVVEVFTARSLLSRARGLIRRPPLPRFTALHLKPCWCVHTAWMQRPIDVVFLDGRHAVIKVVGSLRPWRMSGHRSARSVLELNAGEAVRLRFRAGDTLVLKEAAHDLRCA
jgi:uncharacterized membrane protein (UPF0127 family)